MVIIDIHGCVSMTHALMKPKVVSPCCLTLCPPCATTSHHNHHTIISLHLNYHNQRISVRPTPKSNQILCLHRLWHSICCHKTLQIWIPHLRKWLNPRKQKRLCTLPTLSILPFVAKPIHFPHLMFNPFSMPRSLLNSLKYLKIKLKASRKYERFELVLHDGVYSLIKRKGDFCQKVCEKL